MYPYISVLSLLKYFSITGLKINLLLINCSDIKFNATGVMVFWTICTWEDTLLGSVWWPILCGVSSPSLLYASFVLLWSASGPSWLLSTGCLPSCSCSELVPVKTS